MAKMNDLTQKVILYFEGTQAMNQLKVLEAQAEKLNQEYEEMKKLQGTPGFDSKKFQALEKQIAATEKEMGGMVSSMKSYAGILDEMSSASIRQLATARTSLKNLIRGWSEVGESDETLQKWSSSLEQVTARINALRSGFSDPLAASRDTMGLTINQMERLKEALATEQRMVANDKEAWDMYGEAIRRVSADMDKIKGLDTPTLKEGAMKVVSTPYNYSVDEIREAVKTLEELQQKQRMTKEEWASMSGAIQKAKEHIQGFSDAAKMDAMSKQFQKLTVLSTNAINEQQRYWQSVLNNAEKGTAAYLQAERKLQAISQEMNDRRDTQAGAVMGDLANHSVAEIQEAIKVTEQLRDAQKAGSAEYDIYAEEIKKAKEYLQGYVDLNKQIEMEDMWKNLTTLSTNALVEQKKYWQEMVNGAQNGSKELQDYQNKLKAVTDLENARMKSSARETLTTGLQNSGTADIKQAIDWLTKYQATIEPLSEEWREINAQIEAGNERLKQLTDQTKLEVMNSQFENLASLSTSALNEQKKYWEGVYNSAERASDEYKQAEENLARMQELSKARLTIDAREVMWDVKTGQFSGTIEQTQEAIKLLQEYNNKVNDIESDAFKDTEEVIAKLNLQLSTATQHLMSYDEAQDKLARMNELEAIRVGDEKKDIKARDWTDSEKEEWKQLSEEVERVNKSIAAYKKSLKEGDTKKLEQVNKELRQSQVYANRASAAIEDMDDFLTNGLHTASLEQLQVAAKDLEQRISKATKGTENYVKATAKMREVNKRIKSITKDMEDQGSVIEKTAQRLTSYVAVYGAYNLVAGKVREFFQTNVQLSDAMADVQKTTGMTADEVANLGKQMDAMDTRTSQQQLYELAATAGQLGIRGEEDIMGFVNASNMITVALNELGAEGTASLMKIATLTGEIASEGTEGALLKIGSAINELTANTAATAGPIVDFISRIGGVASASGVATHEMAALGATFNALGQETEVAGTAVNQMLTALTSAVRSQSMGFAQALNVDLQALTDLVNQGKSMEALVMVFESLQKAGGISEAALKALGSEGTRNNRIVTSLVENIDVLKTNLNTSAQAFEDNVSIMNEYNVKNENAAALLERIKNTIVETFSNPVVVERITGWLQSLKDMVEWLVKSEGAWFALKTVLVQIVAIKFATNLMNMKRACKELAIEIALLSKNFGNFKAGMALLGKEIWALVRGTTTLKNVWTAFGLVLKSNPIMTVVSIVTAAAGAIYMFTRNTKEASEVTEEFARNETKLANQFSKTTNEAETLVGKIKALKVEDKERSRLISEFNSKYSKYIGYMLQDKATTDEVTAAYKLLNLELEKDYQLRLLKLQTQNLDKDYVEGQAAYIKAIREELKDAGVDDAVITKTIGYINTLVAKGETLSGVLKYIKENAGVDIPAFEQKTTIVGRKTTTTSVITDWGEALSNYVEYGRQYKKAREELTAQEETANKEAAEDTYKQQKQYLDKEYANLKAMTGTEGEELEKRKTAYTNFYNTLNGYLKSATGKQKEELQAFMETFKTETGGIEELRSVVDIWGKSSNLENWTTFGDVIKNLNTASPESLVAALDKMEAETKGISEAALSTFNEINHTDFDTSNLDAFNADVFKAAQKLRARLKELNRDTSGNFLWGSSGSDGEKEAEREARKEMNAALAALEEHFLKRKVIIQQAYLDQKISGEDMNRQIAENDEEFRNARIELRKLLAGDANTFNQSLYPELDGKNLQETSRVLQTIGDAVVDGLRKNVQKDETEIREGAIKIRKAFEDELLKYDIFGSFEDKFAKMLDELGVLTSKLEDEWFAEDNEALRKDGIDKIIGLTPEHRKQRIAELVQFADESYKVNADGLKELMMQNTQFSNWVKNLDEDQMNVLLQKLRWYYDERLSLTKRYQDQMNKEFEIAYEQSGERSKHEQKKLEVSEEGERLGMMEDLGISVDYKDKLQQTVDEYLAEVAKQKARMEDALTRMDAAAMDMEEAEQNYGTDSDEYRSAEARYMAAQTNMTQIQFENNQLRAENERNQTQIVLDEWKKRAEKMGEYASLFGDYLGEEVMLSKQANDARARGDLETAKKIEDQRKKNKQALIQNLLNMIIDEAALWAKELALKQMFNALSVQSDKEKATEEVSLTNRKSLVTILLNALTGQSEEHKKGLPGLVTGAIIFAATMALQAFAKSAVANMFPEAASGSTTNRKLSTGMLTYAEGNYPVLGNDGKVYNAKYEGAKMKTGVYSGGAHFGIFSEKQPEMIVDGKTTQKLILNYPYIYDAITTIAKNGRLVNAMPTFATGDYPAGMQRISTDAVAMPMQDEEAIAREERTNAIMEQTTAMLARLSRQIDAGITAHVDGLENYKQQKKNERFLKRRGID